MDQLSMNAFVAAWSRDDPVAMPSVAEEAFAVSQPQQHCIPHEQDEDWIDLMKSFEENNPTPDFIFDNVFDIPHGAMSTHASGVSPVAKDPPATPSSAVFTMPSTLSPPDSAAQPVLPWSPSLAYDPQLQQQGLYPGTGTRRTVGGAETEYHTFRFDALAFAGEDPLETGHDDLQTPPLIPFYHDAQNEDLLIAMGNASDHHAFAVQPAQNNFQGEEDDNVNGNEEDREIHDQSYAILLYKCLLTAPNYTRTLREIYNWIALHSDKAKDPESRGWQNSVRHNLSMNQAYERVQADASSGAKKTSLWKLTAYAVKHGVVSTTHYRKQVKKPRARGQPAPNRQKSGAKGGNATKAASRRQRALRSIQTGPYVAPARPAVHTGYAAFDVMPSPRLTNATHQSPYFMTEHAGGMPSLLAYPNASTEAPLFFADNVHPAPWGFEMQQQDFATPVFYQSF